LSSQEPMLNGDVELHTLLLFFQLPQ
jgi:hypothetical protein